uniref:Mannosyl-oligosaccharide glucosidase n=1 Tax=Parascaris univalens TaxID=6257 RepID=A0A915CHJ0_PARUN
MGFLFDYLIPLTVASCLFAFMLKVTEYALFRGNERMGRTHATSKQIGSTGKKAKREGVLWRMFIVTVLMVFVAIGIQYYYHNYIYLAGLITKKSDLPRLELNLDVRTWGTYRSHVYFGLRTPHPDSPLFGLIWYEQPRSNVIVPPVRHWCNQNVGIKSYGWTLADGRTFGKQIIHDASFDLATEWINVGHTWTSRIRTSSTIQTKVALIFYFLIQDEVSFLHQFDESEQLRLFSGYSQLLGNFTITFDSNVSTEERSFLAERSLEYPDATNVKETMIAATEVDREHQTLRLPNRFIGIGEGNTKLIAIQLNVPMNSTVEVSFSTDVEEAVTGEMFEEILHQRSDAFIDKFESTFGLAAKGYSGFYQYMGRYALSNMLGSIGFTSGYNRVQSRYSTKESLYGRHELLTSCPSRSTFPRGFLWDEGFHHMLIRKFDPELSLQIIFSWLNTMNVEGWIPREMILSKEDEMLVPSEFLLQKDSIANPPMFFYLIQRFLSDEKFMKTHREAVLGLYPRLRLWHTWLNSTQTGPKPGTYRWHGRNATTQLELNPKTLPSGLDDFPRATHPTDDEYHLDLRCWMAIAAKTLEQLAELAGEHADAVQYAADAQYLANLDLLNSLHWSKEAQRYCDYGLHSTRVELERQTDPKDAHRNPNLPPSPPPPKNRVTKEPPRLGFVENTFGYLSLYPVMLQLLPHDSVNLRTVLESIRSEKDLWSNYGLRSISTLSPYYKAHNTEHDPPYWRGAIWINVNYLMLSGLKHYSSIAGPNQELAFQIYSELRNNLVSNVVREFKRTGYLWESYADDSGHGRGAHPFTGWSSLVLSAMAEQYD